MKTKSSFAFRIQQALYLRGLKQKDLCNITGIPKSAMSQYCKGNFVPKRERLALIAQALRVDESWLMGYDRPMDGSPSVVAVVDDVTFKIGCKTSEDQCALILLLQQIQSASPTHPSFEKYISALTEISKSFATLDEHTIDIITEFIRKFAESR